MPISFLPWKSLRPRQFLRAALISVSALLPLAADLPAAPLNTQKSPKVWLSDLPEQDAVVGSGTFGKNGLGGFQPWPIMGRGGTSHHGLGVHPDAHVQYNLGKKYRTFRAMAAMNYSAERGSEQPVVFRVLGDGKQLWKSPGGMRSFPQASPCMLDITGVDVLRLEVFYKPGAKGSRDYAHAVWIEPYVSADPPQPEILALFDAVGFSRVEKANAFMDRVRATFAKEDFNGVEACAKEARENDFEAEGQTLLSYYYTCLSQPVRGSKDWQRHLAVLERWKKALPDSATPLVALGKTYYRYAWSIRSEGFSNPAGQDANKLFEERLAKGHTYLEEALNKNTLDGELFLNLINYEIYQGPTRQKVTEYFNRGRKIAPRYYSLYSTLANYLMRDSHGQPGDLQQMAERIRRKIGGDLGDEIYFRMACVPVNGLGERYFAESNFKYEDLKPGIRVMMRDHVETFQYVNYGCFLACLAGDKELAAQLMARLDVGTCEFHTWRSYEHLEQWRRKVDPQADPAEELQMLDGDNGAVRGLAFIKNNRLLSGGDASVIDRWDIESGKLLDTVNILSMTRGFAVDAQGRRVIVCYGSEHMFMTGAVVRELDGVNELDDSTYRKLRGHGAGVCNVAISRDGSHCATASQDKTARIWKADDPSQSIVLPHPETVFDIAFSSDGKLAATTTLHGGLYIWDAQTGARKGESLTRQQNCPSMNFVHFLPGNQALVACALDGAIQRWNLVDRTVEQINRRREDILSLALSPDGRWLAAGLAGGRVEVYSISPLAFVHSYLGHYSQVNALAFSPDSKMLASGADDNAIKLWPISKLKLPSEPQSPAKK